MRPCDICGDAAHYAVAEVARDFSAPLVATCWACKDAGFAERIYAGESAAELRRTVFEVPLRAPVPQAPPGPLFARGET
jgi:hypothetical protein